MLRLADELDEPISRDQARAHFTASAFVDRRGLARVCLVEHAKLGRLLQPGGHIEPRRLARGGRAARGGRGDGARARLPPGRAAAVRPRHPRDPRAAGRAGALPPRPALPARRTAASRARAPRGTRSAKRVTARSRASPRRPRCTACRSTVKTHGAATTPTDRDDLTYRLSMLSFFDNKRLSPRSVMTATRASRAVGVASVLLSLALAISVAFGAFLILNAAAARYRTATCSSARPYRCDCGSRRSGSCCRRALHDGWSSRRSSWNARSCTRAPEHSDAARAAHTASGRAFSPESNVGSVRLGIPFGSGTVSRLRAIAGVLIIGGPLAEAVNEGLRTALFSRLSEAQQSGVGTAGYTIPGNVILAGLGALVLAEVFAHGVSLRETSRRPSQVASGRSIASSSARQLVVNEWDTPRS